MAHFNTTLEVRTYECDIYGHVNNATFLNYLEYARVELLKEMGYSLNALMKMGVFLLVIKIEIEYKRPAFPGDKLLLSIEWIKRGNSSAVFLQQIKKADDESLIADARVTWVVTDAKGKPMAMPSELLNAYRQKFDVDI